MYFWVKYLSLSLKIWSSISQQWSCDLAWSRDPHGRYFGWECRRAPRNLRGWLGRKLHDLCTPLWTCPLHICQHTHTNSCEVRQRASDKGWKKTLEMQEVWTLLMSRLCMKRELSLEKNQVPIFIFHLFHYFDRDSMNTFLIHKHRPCEWENGIGNVRSHIQIQILWWLFIGSSTVVTLGR